MKNNIAIELKGVSKKYILHHEKPTLVENVLKRSEREEFWALKDINLVIKKGERVGIIGPNGSGKTTLLEIISGITTPTEGKVKTSGKIVSLIELEAGFHPELTGEENISLNGLLVGMSKEDVKRRLKKIVSFADIGQFIDAPFYTYSQGMMLRLGFSIAMHADPDILLLDEGINGGDVKFQRKSVKKIDQMLNDGKTVLVVSHWLEFLAKYSKKIVWMEGARIVEIGGTNILNKYRTRMLNRRNFK
ncbi:hypothetical protein A2714_03195 [Candidatus Woesebacteria bacterium RIFCSPHIGHO2_01_FULL_38_9]|uniref:ABC transporter domain-containing protein n=2 Tax=Candidatus Woeseibacteriota TaxID=1752722 RepID=A0A1F7Y1J5_9BACT|nr:MAG: hypothetical protein A2714_03195 [Candidatus Woesebacteria bacterium RIFCSPHIGHO2_01_FULL_38_9]OGM61043.1 MAG: hypothetical protein A3A75_02670 [Candidatus Woesebacteria bacterium RIFCSPLOWO2_01_FULL_39_10]